MGKKIKPLFFKTKSDLPKNTLLINTYERSLEELFYIENPRYKKEMPESKKELLKYLSKNKVKALWIYFPWKKIAVFTVPESIFFKLRTARNKDVIDLKEQSNFRSSTVGIVGLSVGSVLLSALVANGGPKNIRLADFDDIEISNLNRMKGTVLDIGKNKAEVAALNTWELDPFAKIDIWDKGVNKNSLEKFIIGKNKLNIFVDTMDSLDLKILARFLCKKHKVPVVMITENADNSIIDVERYDIDKNLSIFNGRLGKLKMEDFKNLNYSQWLRLASQIVGPEFLSSKMQESILKLGKTVASVPQLSTSVSIGGATATVVIRRILNKNLMPSGRYLINVDEKIIPNFNSKTEILRRKKQTELFIKSLIRK